MFFWESSKAMKMSKIAFIIKFNHRPKDLLKRIIVILTNY